MALRSSRRRQHRVSTARPEWMSTTGVDGHDGCHFYNSAYVEWGERVARLLHRDL